MRIWRVLSVAGFVCGIAGEPATAQLATDMRLSNAGFIMRPANTPEQLARLRRLPPRKFVARTKAGARYFVYADPDVCKCVFLGDERAMQAYRDMVTPPTGVPTAPVPATGASVENQMIEDMDSDLDSSIGGGDILDFASGREP